jgi:hypothetical protein
MAPASTGTPFKVAWATPRHLRIGLTTDIS